jgi:hypothetical protein
MPLRRISYRLVNGQLQRSVTLSSNTGAAPWTFPAASGPWQRRLDSIVNDAVFSYADSTGAATTDPAKVKTVTITVTVATYAAKARQATYTTAVTLRAAA